MTRDRVFISYSHADSEWLKRLQTMLTPLLRQGTLKVWTDTDIKPGQVWQKEIEREENDHEDSAARQTTDDR